MNSKYRIPIFKPGLSRLATALMVCGSLLTPTLATAVTFETPEGVQGAPRTETTGGASRNGGECFNPTNVSSASLTPLLPENNMGLTVDARPTFFVYVPPSTAKQASFTLKDEGDNAIYHAKFSLPETGGAIGIELPETFAGLELEKNYQWIVEVHCAAEFDPDNPLVVGWVRRTQLNSATLQQIQQSANFVDRAQLYGDAGMWFDSLKVLADAMQTQPGDTVVEQNWEELLTSQGLGAIAAQPVTQQF